ncbi:uncharacterized protein [Narcine bancroftii]|uniref:uncharacterized protein n=1 Tax=Narcine bancroftii TaxID=1343680 RepID=UPI0038313C49
MASNWSDAEVRLLLDNLTQEAQEKELTGTVSNGPTYERVATVLSASGHAHTKTQVVTKLKNQRKKFHALLDHNHRSGRGRMDWKYFRQCQTIWGSSCSAEPISIASAMERTSSQDLFTEASQVADSIVEAPEMQSQEVQDSMEDTAGTAQDAPRTPSPLADRASSEVALTPVDTGLRGGDHPRRKRWWPSIAKELQSMVAAVDQKEVERDLQRAELALEQQRAAS